MPLPSAFAPVRLTSAFVAALACLAAAGCGGGNDYLTPAASGLSGSTALSGTVAVGAPITNGKLRILDANGAVVASDVAIDAEGRYAGVTLTGPAPYRLEACGYAGPNYLCVYSVANAAGTANVTPLTSAMVLLATGASPDAMMAPDAPAVSASGVSTAQDQLRTSLSGVLSGAGVAATLDFVSGSLSAGSRSGYDGVLDAVGVSVGQDAGAFVQISPRIGSGNLFMQKDSKPLGTMTMPGTANLGLAGIETLFRSMSAAMASATACADANTGIRRSLSSIAQMTLGDSAVRGPDGVAAGLCQFFATGDDGATPMWGSTLLSPTLGRCDLSGTVPVCAISFVIRSPDGDVMPVGDGMGVTRESGAWKFMGDLLPIQIRATARAQRTVRLDTATPVVDYDRAIQLEVAAVSGLACARVAQHTADGNATTIAYYKRFPGAAHQQRLSLWGSNGMGNGASLDPLAGSVRSADDTWLTLPQGTEGDAVIRNFYQGGRTVTFSLFADDSCSTPFTVAGRSVFDVEIQGVPPVSSAMDSLPWPELDGATATALRSLTLDAGATATFHAAWTFARGPLGLDDITVCGNRDSCGDGGTGRIGSGRVRPSARDNNVALHNNGAAVTANSMKMLALSGRNSEGVGLESNYMSCPGTAAGESCH